MSDDIGGVWRTVGGRRIFIKDGEDLGTAMKKSGKFENIKEKEDVEKNVEEETKKVEEKMSNEAKPIKKEEVDVKVIKERGKLTDDEAKECVRVAENLWKQAEEKEPTISRDVIDSVKQVGGKMYGLDFRMKQPSSMAGKIGADAKEDNVSFEKAGSNIKDAVRYTAIIRDGDFTKGYNNIKTSLEEKGYKELRCKNFYQMYEDNKSCQKAIQCVYEDKSGYKFEFQFHTPGSQGAKELNHPLYEEQRKATTSIERRNDLEYKMRNIGKYVNNPENVLNIKSHN